MKLSWLETVHFKNSETCSLAMNFQNLSKVETFQTYLDLAFKNGMKEVERVRAETTSPNRLFRSKRIEKARIEVVGKSLISSLDYIGKSFPRFDALAPFYQELVRCTVDYDQLKKSLGALNWAKKQVIFLLNKYLGDIQRTARLEQVNKVRTAFSGRASSVFKQVKDNLVYLEECRKIMKAFPSLKTSVVTIVIAGMPNVGKSTLLACLTGSKPKVAPYPFTTQRLNFGYDQEGNQYIDTPGLLDRPLIKRNKIERQAILALKHLASVVVFVFDPTESSGYSIKEQEDLLRDIKKEFNLPFILVSNKSDIGQPVGKAISVSAKDCSGIKEVQTTIYAVIEKSK